MPKKCAVIGGGIAGLATAIRLVNQGWHVEVFERNTQLGGKVNEIKLGPYRFDYGPTVLTMPHLIDDLFHLHSKDPREYFEYSRLDELSRYFFEDGASVIGKSEVLAYDEEVKSKIGLGVGRFRKYLSDAAKKFKLTEDVFLKSSLHQVKNYTRSEAIRGIAQFPSVGTFTSMASWNNKLFNNEYMERIANRYAQYNGSDPYQMAATFNVIGHVEIEHGVFAVKGGMRRFVEALEKLCRELKVEIHTSCEVEKIVVEHNKACGIQINGKMLDFDVVVSNADVHHTKKALLGESPKVKSYRNPSSSSVLFMWGVNRKFEKMGAHNYLFGPNCEKEFHEIFKKHQLPEDGALYIHIGSKINGGDAPVGHENWFVLVNAPFHNGQDWDGLVKAVKSKAMDRLSSHLDINFEGCIEAEKVIRPPEIESEYNCYKGAIFGESSNSIWSAFLRQPNFSRKIKGLYFAGGSVHPGAGIPLCLNSAEITARLIKERE